MRRVVIFVLLALVAALSGCKKKQPQVPQPQTQAPTITQPPQVQPQPQPQPPVSAQPQPPQPQPQPQPSTAGAATTTRPKPKVSPKKKVAKKTPPKPPDTSKKTVVHNGSTPEGGGQLSAGLPQDEARHQRQNTAQLLADTDTNLRGITRSLSTDEQAMLQQIRAYMQQSRAADADGDTERAYNLAVKAHLLSDELVKR